MPSTLEPIPPRNRASLQERRKAALRQAGVTQAELAARIGVSRQSVGLVLADHHRSRRVEQAIADAAGIPVDELFPGAGGGANAAIGNASGVEPRPAVVHAAELASAAGSAPNAAAGATATFDSIPHNSLDSTRAPAAQASFEQTVVARHLEQRVDSTLQEIAQDLFLGLADRSLAPDAAVVRAVAAALRELRRSPG